MTEATAVALIASYQGLFGLSMALLIAIALAVLAKLMIFDRSSAGGSDVIVPLMEGNQLAVIGINYRFDARMTAERSAAIKDEVERILKRELASGHGEEQMTRSRKAICSVEGIAVIEELEVMFVGESAEASLFLLNERDRRSDEVERGW